MSSCLFVVKILKALHVFVLLVITDNFSMNMLLCESHILFHCYSEKHVFPKLVQLIGVNVRHCIVLYVLALGIGDLFRVLTQCMLGFNPIEPEQFKLYKKWMDAKLRG